MRYFEKVIIDCKRMKVGDNLTLNCVLYFLQYTPIILLNGDAQRSICPFPIEGVNSQVLPT